MSQRGTTPRTEFIAGLTTFVTAAYLIVVIPSNMAVGGVDIGAVTTTTIVAFVFGTLLMAFYARLPFVVGPGLGTSAMIGTTLALTEGVRWQTGIAVAFWSGTLFMILTFAGLREVVIRVVPAEIKVALSAALGLFIITLGFRNAGLAIADPRVNAFTLGNFAAHGAIVALVGLVVVVALHIRKGPGSILLAMVAATAPASAGNAKCRLTFFALPGSIAPGCSSTSGARCNRRCSRTYSRFSLPSSFPHGNDVGAGRRS